MSFAPWSEDAFATVERDFVYLEPVRMGVREQLGDYALRHLEYDLMRTFDPPGLVQRLTTHILGKTSGPKVYEESVSATALVVGFASWWDHWKATYRGRWWMRWRRWDIAYVERTETKHATVRVEATVAAIFPHARDVPDFLGPAHPVVWGHRLNEEQR